MKANWNDEALKRRYLRTLEEAKKRQFSDEELESPYLDKLSHKTKSYRIMRMVTLAYFLGILKGISEVDDGKTPVTFG